MSVFGDNLLKGKTAFVTGGGSGINLQIALRFAQHGANIAILGRNQEKLNKATQELEKHGGKVLNFSADVRDYAAVAEALKKTREELGQIDILVCGAAGNFPAAAIGMSANGFKAVVDIDLLGTFNTCRAAYEHLKKPGACIINISASQAWVPTPWQSHVCAAKAGVDMVTKTLAIEWGPEGIRVNSVAPGPTDDTEGMRRLTPTEEMKAKLAATIPLRRYGTKDEIADLALFLCSDAAQYITGAVIACDGGSSLLGSGSFVAALSS